MATYSLLDDPEYWCVEKEAAVHEDTQLPTIDEKNHWPHLDTLLYLEKWPDYYTRRAYGQIVSDLKTSIDRVGYARRERKRMDEILMYTTQQINEGKVIVLQHTPPSIYGQRNYPLVARMEQFLRIQLVRRLHEYFERLSLIPNHPPATFLHVNLKDTLRRFVRNIYVGWHVFADILDQEPPRWTRETEELLLKTIG